MLGLGIQIVVVHRLISNLPCVEVSRQLVLLATLILLSSSRAQPAHLSLDVQVQLVVI